MGHATSLVVIGGLCTAACGGGRGTAPEPATASARPTATTALTPPPAPMVDAGVDAGVAAATAATAPPGDAPDVIAQVRLIATTDRDGALGRAPLLARPWCEGASGDGLGETLTLEFARPTTVTGVRVGTGLARGASVEPDPGFNRPTAVTLSLDGAPPLRAEVTLDDDPSGEVTWDLEPARAVTRVTLGFGAVTKGKRRDSCLRDLTLYGVTPVTVPDAALATYPAALAAAVAAFASCDPAALGAVAAFPYHWRYTDEGYEAAKVAVKKDARALVASCKAIPEQIRRDLPGSDRDARPTFLGDAVELGVANDFMRLELLWRDGAWKVVGSHLDLL